MRIDLGGDPTAPAAARAFVTAHVDPAAVPEGVAVADVVLVASELVTNGVRAGASRIGVGLEVSRGRLQLAVEDDGAGWPALVGLDEDGTSGRGLHIVEQLTDAWDVAATSTGKRVTATWSASAGGPRA